MSDITVRISSKRLISEDLETNTTFCVFVCVKKELFSLVYFYFTLNRVIFRQIIHELRDSLIMKLLSHNTGQIIKVWILCAHIRIIRNGVNDFQNVKFCLLF